MTRRSSSTVRRGRWRTPFRDVLARALAVQEVNAAMGVIVAAPMAAGGAGVLPAVLTGLAAARGLWMVPSSMLARQPGLIGAVVAERVAVWRRGRLSSSAAAGMATGAATKCSAVRRPRSRTRSLACNEDLSRLVCDPLGGLVELPCVFRNATGAAIALAAVEMALAGITFAIPADEVIDTMGDIGREMDVRYRETTGGGLARDADGAPFGEERLVQIKRG